MNEITRRRLFKAGAALPLALHALHCRAEDKPKSKQAPRRFMFICNSLGFYRPNFLPKTRGDLSTSRYLKDLSTQEKLTVFENFFHPGMETSNHDSEKSFLTGAPKPEAPNFANSISLDQLIASKVGRETRFSSLPLSIYDRGWGCSWNDRGVAIPPMSDPSQIFDMLFGAEDLSVKRNQIREDQEVLRCLHRDLQQLKDAGGDGAKIASYENVIVEFEKQLSHQEFWLNAKKPEVDNTLSNDVEFEFSTKVKNLLELAKLAFQTDSTRVITFSMDWIYGAIRVPGATGGWHTLSHHGGNQEKLAKLCQIESNIMLHLNDFLSELDSIEEGGGSLLDNTTVVIGSNFGDSSNHTCNNLPLIVAGGGFRHQQHVIFPKPTHLCNLWLELLLRSNLDIDSFGSSEANMGLLS
ncbi:MAG: DUF1552 domain-containing protein [Planctomycetota bacterium]